MLITFKSLIHFELIFVCAVHSQSLSHIRLFETLWTVGHQTPLSMGFSRQEYWRGLPCPPPGDLPDSGIESESPMSPALAGKYFTISALGKPYHLYETCNTQNSEIVYGC